MNMNIKNPAPHAEKRMLSEKEARVYLGLGRGKTREFCNDIKATMHIGSRVLYDKMVIDSYLDKARKDC